MARDGERGRGDWKARLGSRNSGPYAEASGDDTGPVDIAAVRRDDALIDALAGDGTVDTNSAEEHQLAMLLADWRAEIIAPPLPAGPDLDEIVAAVNQEIGARQVRVGAQSTGRLRLLRPIAGTAAAIALVIGGMTAFSYNAEPGDPLWRVKEVVFSEQAQTTVAARADDDLSAASTLVTENPTQAKTRLEQAKENADQVSDPAKRNQLINEFNRLVDELRARFPDIAAQLESSTSTSPAESTTSGQPRPTSSTGGPTTESGKPGGTNPTIMQAPVEPSGSPSESPAPPTTSKGSAPPAPTTTQPPVITSQPPVEPPGNGTPTTSAPGTVSKPTVVEPTGQTGSPTVRPTEGSSGTTTGSDS